MHACMDVSSTAHAGSDYSDHAAGVGWEPTPHPSHYNHLSFIRRRSGPPPSVPLVPRLPPPLSAVPWSRLMHIIARSPSSQPPSHHPSRRRAGAVWHTCMHAAGRCVLRPYPHPSSPPPRQREPCPRSVSHAYMLHSVNSVAYMCLKSSPSPHTDRVVPKEATRGHRGQAKQPDGHPALCAPTCPLCMMCMVCSPVGKTHATHALRVSSTWRDLLGAGWARVLLMSVLPQAACPLTHQPARQCGTTFPRQQPRYVAGMRMAYMGPSGGG